MTSLATFAAFAAFASFPALSLAIVAVRQALGDIGHSTSSTRLPTAATF
jgi:hypothetical protein